MHATWTFYVIYLLKKKKGKEDGSFCPKIETWIAIAAQMAAQLARVCIMAGNFVWLKHWAAKRHSVHHQN